MTPEELAKARILVTNDDGINAPGLDAMIDIASQLSQDVWIVAPEYNQSGAGHSLTLDGQSDTDYYTVFTTGSHGSARNYAINVLDGGFSVPEELYWPEEYSVDGSKLLITLGYYEGASAAVYYPNGNALVRLSGDQGAFICCGETSWTADGSAFYAANPSLGMFNPGLWRVDSSSGTRWKIEPSPTSFQGTSRGIRVHGAWLEMRSTSANSGGRSRLASSRSCSAFRTYWSGIGGRPKTGPR